jgi:hypothetical protein
MGRGRRWSTLPYGRVSARITEIIFLGQWDMGQDWDASVPLVFHSGAVLSEGKPSCCSTYRVFHRRNRFSTKAFFSYAWDSGTKGVKDNGHNNKVSQKCVPLLGPMGQSRRKARVQALACPSARRRDKLKLAIGTFSTTDGTDPVGRFLPPGYLSLSPCFLDTPAPNP